MSGVVQAVVLLQKKLSLGLITITATPQERETHLRWKTTLEPLPPRTTGHMKGSALKSWNHLGGTRESSDKDYQTALGEKLFVCIRCLLISA